MKWLQRMQVLAIASMIVALLHATGAQSAELAYTLQSPLIGGTNSALLQIENNRIGAIKQKDAKAAADEQARKNAEQQAINNSPAARFASALQAQMFTSISQQLNQRISSLQPGQAGSFEAGDVQISYTRGPSSVHVVIATPTGNTALELPTGP
ncbi:MAG TPA: curli assembly protein CsgF [Burkholderiaceae bacterium]|nr:curli assembly protein CsgF [Burkholderiaceae bacterium]